MKCSICQEEKDEVNDFYKFKGYTAKRCKECIRKGINNKRAERRARGLCPKCGGQPMKGYVLCSKCKESYDKTFKAFIAKKRELGECIHCGKPAKPGRLRCEECISRIASTRGSNSDPVERAVAQ